MSKVEVSILVPVYNGEKYIGRCLRSLTGQVCDINFEIIVIDDGSTDLTPYAIGQFGRDIETVHHDHNLGLPAALNSGLSKCRGQYVVRVDADDYVNRWFIQFLYEYKTQNPILDAVASDYLLVDVAENVIERKSSSESPIACGIFFETEHLRALGGYNEEFLLFEDKEFRSRFDQKYRVGHIGLPLYRYRRHEGNITNNEEAVQKYERLLFSESREQKPKYL